MGATVFGGDVVGAAVVGVAVVGAAVVGEAVVGAAVVGATVFGVVVVGVAIVGGAVFGVAVVGAAVVGAAVVGEAVVVGAIASSVLVLPGRRERLSCMELEINVKTWKEDLKELWEVCARNRKESLRELVGLSSLCWQMSLLYEQPAGQRHTPVGEIVIITL